MLVPKPIPFVTWIQIRGFLILGFCLLAPMIFVNFKAAVFISILKSLTI